MIFHFDPLLGSVYCASLLFGYKIIIIKIMVEKLTQFKKKKWLKIGKKKSQENFLLLPLHLIIHLDNRIVGAVILV